MDDRIIDHAEEALIGRAARGVLSADEQVAFDGHVVRCVMCAAELEATRIFDAATRPDPADEVLSQFAVQRAMASVGKPPRLDSAIAPGPFDQALNRLAIDGAMAKLERPLLAPRPRPARWAAAGFAALAAAVVGFGVFRARQAPVPATTAVLSTRPLVLADGSEIAPDAPTTVVQVGEDTPARTTVRLPAGAARFKVRHDNRRLFRVDAGPIEIEDLGTVFRVAHEPDARVRVSVSEGRVAVLDVASRLRVELRAGDERVFPETSDPHLAVAPPREPPGPSAAMADVAARGQSRARNADSPADLLGAADTARRSGAPRAAVAPLRRLVERYPRDPRAPSAAFTLGWLLLTDLDRPREAAVAFSDAERIAPRGALAEDAAARVAEAWQKAGDARHAVEAARHYARMYPNGRHIGLMRGLIGER